MFIYRSWWKCTQCMCSKSDTEVRESIGWFELLLHLLVTPPHVTYSPAMKHLFIHLLSWFDFLASLNPIDVPSLPAFSVHSHLTQTTSKLLAFPTYAEPSRSWWGTQNLRHNKPVDHYRRIWEFRLFEERELLIKERIHDIQCGKVRYHSNKKKKMNSTITWL